MTRTDEAAIDRGRLRSSFTAASAALLVAGAVAVGATACGTTQTGPGAAARASGILGSAAAAASRLADSAAAQASRAADAGASRAAAAASAAQSIAASLAASPPAELASASAAAASIQARASAALQSASAAVSQANASAAALLGSLPGSGNAVGDVKVGAVSSGGAGGRPTAVLTLSNSTGNTATYAVLVAFVDGSGKTLESTVVGARGIAGGASATVVAEGNAPAPSTTGAKVVKALRV